jgi:hypothetical protein
MSAEPEKSSAGEGVDLPAEQRREFERAFSGSFCGVRIDADAHADALARSHHAPAVTRGSEIFFCADEYRPGTLRGDAILADELAHVAQQTHAREVDHNTHGGRLERDADASVAAALLVRHGLAPPGTAMPRERSGLGLRGCAATGTRSGS